MIKNLIPIFAAAVLSGCVSSGFIAVSIAGNQDGGIYSVQSDKKIIHTSLPRISYIIPGAESGLYYATQNGTKSDRNGKVIVLKAQRDGSMKIEQQVSVNGITPCHLALSPCGKYLFTANYSSGNLSKFKLDKGKLSASPQLITHKGSGVTRRQTAPHPHFAGFNPAAPELFVCDLGTDEVVIYDYLKDETVPVAKLKLAPGAGPRHLAFSPCGKTIYVANELDSTATSFIKTPAGWKKVKTISTRPENPVAKKNFPGAIKMTHDGRFFFITNRGDDTIAMFETGKNGDFRLCKNIPAQGKYPSDIIIDETANTVRVINLKSGTAVKFKLNRTAVDLELLPGVVEIPRGIGFCE